jgi:hypothetical protein
MDNTADDVLRCSVPETPADRPNFELPPAQDLAGIPREERTQLLVRALEAGAFDYLDFGTHTGGGLRVGESLGGKLGLGVEMMETKCQALYKRGRYVISEDIFKLPLVRHSVDFAVCSHILEHMPNRHVVYLLLERLSQFCRKYVYINQPDFTATQYLFEKGLKLAHVGLTKHLTQLPTREIVSMLWDLKLGRFIVAGKRAIHNSSHDWVHAVGAPPNVSKWEDGHLPKPYVEFNPPLYRDIVIVIGIDSSVDLEAIANEAGVSKITLRSYSAMF